MEAQPLSPQALEQLLSSPHWPHVPVSQLEAWTQAYPYCQPLWAALSLAEGDELRYRTRLNAAAVRTADRSVLQHLHTLRKPQVTAAPQDAIDAFLAKPVTITRLKAQADDAGQDLSQLSSELDAPIETEAMALIWLKQGRLDKAKAILDKIALDNPEKKSYFAQLLAQHGQA